MAVAVMSARVSGAAYMACGLTAIVGGLLGNFGAAGKGSCWKGGMGAAGGAWSHGLGMGPAGGGGPSPRLLRHTLVGAKRRPLLRIDHPSVKRGVAAGCWENDVVLQLAPPGLGLVIRPRWRLVPSEVSWS